MTEFDFPPRSLKLFKHLMTCGLIALLIWNGLRVWKRIIICGGVKSPHQSHKWKDECNPKDKDTLAHMTTYAYSLPFG